MGAPVSYAIGQSYAPLMRGDHKGQFILVEGRRGTSKTRSILTHIVARALEYPGSRWLIARSARTRLTGTVLVTLDEQVLPLFGLKPPDNTRETRKTYPLPGGSSIVIEGLDDPNRSTSAEYAGMYVSEGIEIDGLNDVVSLAGALRQDCGIDRWQCIVDLNPGPPSHWSNKIAEDVDPTIRVVRTPADYRRLVRHNCRPVTQPGRWKRIITAHQDNPGYWDSARWTWTQLGKSYLDTLSNLTGYLRQRWLEGQWCAAEGSIFPEFDESRHVWDCPDEFPPPGWPIDLFWDFGVDHPTAISFTTTAPNGRLYVYDEIYEGGKSLAQHVQTIHAKLRGRTIRGLYGDPQMADNHTAYHSDSIVEQVRKLGLRMQTWPRAGNNEGKCQMIEAYRLRLVGDMIRIARRCRNAINEHQSWSWLRTAGGEQRPGGDRPEDVNDHIMDGLLGAVALKLTHTAVSSGYSAAVQKNMV